MGLGMGMGIGAMDAMGAIDGASHASGPKAQATLFLCFSPPPHASDAADGYVWCTTSLNQVRYPVTRLKAQSSVLWSCTRLWPVLLHPY